MRSIIREVVQAAGVFLPMVVFCMALGMQYLRSNERKAAIPAENNVTLTVTTADVAKVETRRDVGSYLLFEQLTR